MAIRIADYSHKHTRSIRNLWMILAFLTAAAFFFMVYVATDNPETSLLLAVPLFVFQILVMMLILPRALEPIDILTRAITHVSGQANNLTPPNINGTRHEKTAMKDMIDVIYRLATSLKPSPDMQTEDEKTQEVMLSVLQKLPFGVTALNDKLEVVYANTAAPVLTSDRGETSIQLMFQQDDTLEMWVQKNAGQSITSSKNWSHIQNLIPGTEGRKVFDVFAHYNSNDTSGIETVLITIDRTDHYVQSEEDMDFISLAAHELRGPITVIKGYINVLEDEMRSQLQPDQVELFERLEVSAARLSGYINNILNVARYDRQHLKLSLREDKLSDIYHIIDLDMRLRASTQGRQLQVTIPEDLPTIAADRNSLSEVMANLIDNALKYSHENGIVQVTAAVEGNFVKCSVQDYGMGMPASVVNGLFTKFYRSHRTSQNFSGTGLGLYISKAVVESHGGTIGVKSKEGEGSIFTFLVPIYSTVADKLAEHGHSNSGIINNGRGWIKNHAMFKG